MITISSSTIAGILVLETAPAESKDSDRFSDFAEDLFEVVSASPCQNILVDLQGFEFITSEVIGQLIMFNKKCRAGDRQLKLCGVSRENRKALRIIRFEELVDIYDSAPKAIVAFKVDAHRPVEIDADGSYSDASLEEAESGDLDAQFRYAKFLESGRGISPDFDAALRWYERAAGRGHVESQHALGMAYAYGIKVPQDFDEAFKWYKRAADQGHSDAQYMIGVSMQYGLIDEADIAGSIDWYNRAAEQGYHPAQEALAELQSDSPTD